MSVGAGNALDGDGLRVEVYLGQWPELHDEHRTGTFSPTTSALVVGPTEVAVVDAQYLREDVAALGDRVASTGRSLGTVHVTHAGFSAQAWFRNALQRADAANREKAPRWRAPG